MYALNWDAFHGSTVPSPSLSFFAWDTKAQADRCAPADWPTRNNLTTIQAQNYAHRSTLRTIL